jgi:hypothetical protein
VNAPFTFSTFPAGNFPAADWDAMWSFSNALVNIACAAVGTNSIALTPFATSPLVPAYQQLAKFTFVAAGSNTGPVTVSVGSLPALALYAPGGAQVSTPNQITINSYYEIVYDATLNSGAGGFRQVGGASSGGGSISYTLVTAAGNYTVLSTDNIILLNKTVPAATSIILPASASRSSSITVKDYGYNANSNNITFVPQSGETFDGFTAAQAASNGVAVISIDGDFMTVNPLTSGGWYVL